jgi:hypothetical protein
MKWLIVPLAIQTIAGIALAFRSVSLNTWESDEGIHNSGDRLSLVTGIVFLSGAGLGWYGYSLTQAWCWGFTGFRLVKTCVDAIGLVLLYFVFFRAESTGDVKTRREEWRKVLQSELSRWSSMTCNDVLAELRARDVYELVAESKQYQVEVVLLENTPEYLHVSIAVDDGSLPGSMRPESESFLCRKA